MDGVLPSSYSSLPPGSLSGGPNALTPDHTDTLKPQSSKSANPGMMPTGSTSGNRLEAVKHLMNDECEVGDDMSEAEEDDKPGETPRPSGHTFLDNLRHSGHRGSAGIPSAWKNAASVPVSMGFAQQVKINVILEDEHDAHRSRFILTPNGQVARMWQKLTALAVIYIVGVVSFDMGFNWWKISRPMYICGLLVDMWFWADMIVTFRTGYVHGGHLVMDGKRIAQHYLHFWFWVDLTANVPWESLIMVSKSNRKAIKFLKWLKLPRLLRLGRLRKLMKANARYLNLVILLSSVFLSIHLGACALVGFTDPCSAYVEEEPFSDWSYLHDVDDYIVARHPRLGWECMQDTIANVYFKAAHEATAMLLGVDKGTLMSYVTGGGESSSLLEEVRRYAGYLTDTEESASRDPSAARTRAIKLELLRRRYPLSMVDPEAVAGSPCFSAGTANGVGSAVDPTNTTACMSGFNTRVDMNTYGLTFHMPLDIFGAFMLIFGLYLQGLLFANLTRLLIARHAAETAFRQKHDEVKRELELYGQLIPESVQKRIEKHFEFRWINQAYGPLQLLKPDLLSLSLRGELALYLYKTPVTKVEFLEDAPLSILTKVCLNLEPQDYMLRDTIYRRGEYPTGIFLVDKGKVLLTINDRALVEDQMFNHRHSRSIRETTISLGQEVSSGDHFGTGAAIAAIQVHADQDHRHVANKKSAIAITVCRLLCLSIKLFREICDAHPKFFWELKHLDEADTGATDTTGAQGKEIEDQDSQGRKSEPEVSAPHVGPDKEYPSPFRRSACRSGEPEMAERVKRLHQEVQSHSEKLDQMISSLEVLVQRTRAKSKEAGRSQHSTKRESC